MGKNPGGIIMPKWASSQDSASVLWDDSCHPCEAALAIVAGAAKTPRERTGGDGCLDQVMGQKLVIELCFFKATGLSITHDL